MYRDDTAAARVHLAMLERQIAHQRSVRSTLSAYRNALLVELSRLQHAMVWYVNGERYGFNEAARHDDLSPTKRPGGRPTDDSIAAAVFQLSEDQVAARTSAILRELASKDPGSEEAQRQVRALEDECASLRRQVEEMARRHPDHPPPPEYKATIWTVLVPVGLVAAALAASLLIL